MQTSILLFSVSEFLDYLEKNIDSIKGEIVHITTLFQSGDRPAIGHLYVLAKAKVGNTLVQLERYCGEIREGEQHSEQMAREKALHIQRKIEDECHQLGLLVERALYVEK